MVCATHGDVGRGGLRQQRAVDGDVDGGFLSALDATRRRRGLQPVQAFHDFPTHGIGRANVDDLEAHLREVGTEVEVIHVKAKARGSGTQLHVARRHVTRCNGDVLRVALEATLRALHGVVARFEVVELIAAITASDSGSTRGAKRDVHTLDGFRGGVVGHKTLDFARGNFFFTRGREQTQCEDENDAHD